MTVEAGSVPAATLAFDRLAADYDAIAARETFQWQRQRVHRILAREFPPGCRVLEVGCGTGLDTAFMAARGLRVIACDPSEMMLRQAERRVREAHMERRVRLFPCGFESIASYLDDFEPEPFDGLVSSFGALNCVAGLTPLGALVERHLRPGSTLLVGLIGRHCLIESLYFGLTGRGRLMTRRAQRGPVAVPVAGVDVPTYYHTVAAVRAAVATSSALVAVTGIGVAVPPPYLEPRWQQVPPIVRRTIEHVDAILGGCPPFNRWGDHVQLRFVKRRGAA